MDAVILAAGRGERLNGIMPRFWKPLMLVNGIPLVLNAVRVARRADATRVIVVVSPENAAPISEVLQFEDVLMIVQRFATGPGDALVTGLQLVNIHDRALVLMGDNVLSVADVKAVAAAEPYGIGVQEMDATPEAARFTRFEKDRWVEKVPISPGQKRITAWVGPITVNPQLAVQHLQYRGDGESLIGPHLDAIAPGAVPVTVSSVDVGTPESAYKETAQ